MGQTIVIASQKGGTGKTTSTLNIGAALARFHNRKILFIDLDPQGSLSIYVGVRPDQLGIHLGNVLQQVDLFDESLVPLSPPGVAILPSHPSLGGFVLNQGIRGQWRSALTAILEKAEKQFDFVLIDCPPTLNAITFDALCVGDAVLIPLQCEFMALRGIQLLLEAVEKAKAEGNPQLEVLGVLPTMFDRRTLHSREVLEEIKTALEDKIRVFPTIIYKSVRFPESAVAMATIFDYAPKIPGAQAYRALAEEVIQYGQKTG